jgi:Cys-rich four helix bundle protein (predicted Tat secretion target)
MQEGSFGRREFITAGALALGAALAERAAAEDHPAHHTIPRADAALAKSALVCVATGDACTAHCLAEFRAGRSELADCAASVAELVAACRALAQLASLGSPQLPAFAAASAGVCERCEQACRKHEKHHAVCRECADACKDCLEQCRRVAKAA